MLVRPLLGSLAARILDEFVGLSVCDAGVQPRTLYLQNLFYHSAIHSQFHYVVIVLHFIIYFTSLPKFPFPTFPSLSSPPPLPHFCCFNIIQFPVTCNTPRTLIQEGNIQLMATLVLYSTEIFMVLLLHIPEGVRTVLQLSSDTDSCH